MDARSEWPPPLYLFSLSLSSVPPPNPSLSFSTRRPSSLLRARARAIRTSHFNVNRDERDKESRVRLTSRRARPTAIRGVMPLPVAPTADSTGDS